MLQLTPEHAAGFKAAKLANPKTSSGGENPVSVNFAAMFDAQGMELPRDDVELQLEDSGELAGKSQEADADAGDEPDMPTHSEQAPSGPIDSTEPPLAGAAEGAPRDRKDRAETGGDNQPDANPPNPPRDRMEADKPAASLPPPKLVSPLIEGAVPLPSPKLMTGDRVAPLGANVRLEAPSTPDPKSIKSAASNPPRSTTLVEAGGASQFAKANVGQVPTTSASRLEIRKSVEQSLPLPKTAGALRQDPDGTPLPPLATTARRETPQTGQTQSSPPNSSIKGGATWPDGKVLNNVQTADQMARAPTPVLPVKSVLRPNTGSADPKRITPDTRQPRLIAQIDEGAKAPSVSTPPLQRSIETQPMKENAAEPAKREHGGKGPSAQTQAAMQTKEMVQPSGRMTGSPSSIASQTEPSLTQARPTAEKPNQSHVIQAMTHRLDTQPGRGQNFADTSKADRPVQRGTIGLTGTSGTENTEQRVAGIRSERMAEVPSNNPPTAANQTERQKEPGLIQQAQAPRVWTATRPEAPIETRGPRQPTAAQARVTRTTYNLPEQPVQADTRPAWEPKGKVPAQPAQVEVQRPVSAQTVAPPSLQRPMTETHMRTTPVVNETQPEPTAPHMRERMPTGQSSHVARTDMARHVEPAPTITNQPVRRVDLQVSPTQDKAPVRTGTEVSKPDAIPRQTVEKMPAIGSDADPPTNLSQRTEDISTSMRDRSREPRPEAQPPAVHQAAQRPMAPKLLDLSEPGRIREGPAKEAEPKDYVPQPTRQAKASTEALPSAKSHFSGPVVTQDFRPLINRMTDAVEAEQIWPASTDDQMSRSANAASFQTQVPSRMPALGGPVPMTQLAQHIARAPAGETEVRLAPEELGRVKMVISQTDVGLHIAMSAEKPETLELMRRHETLLLRDLEQLGYENASLSYQDGGGALPPAKSETEEQSEPDVVGASGAADDRHPRPAARAGGLDLRV